MSRPIRPSAPPLRPAPHPKIIEFAKALARCWAADEDRPRLADRPEARP